VDCRVVIAVMCQELPHVQANSKLQVYLNMHHNTLEVRTATKNP
jgi:hypothetical protein